jgi:choline dehydrogenase
MNCDLSGRIDWGYRGQVTGGRRASLPRGKAVGGSSTVNTCIAMRPDPRAFADWADTAPGWDWQDVLPAFRRLERDADFPDIDHHGADGPTTVVRWREDELLPPARAFRDAALAAGLPWCDDLNRPGAEGVGATPMNRDGRRRLTASDAYLSNALASLHVRAGTLVDRVVVEAGRVTGVATLDDGAERFEAAPRVVLCAGSYATPGILLRSGLGNEAELARQDIPVIEHLPGVGLGLLDHSQVHIPAFGAACDANGPAVQVLAKTTTAGSVIANDVQLCVLNRVDLERYDPDSNAERQVVMLCALLEHAVSTGSVRLASVDPDAAPLIEIDYVAEEEDRRRYRAALRLLADIASRTEIAPLRPCDDRGLADLDDCALDLLVAERVQSAHHPMGTARMGRSSDPLAVVAPDLSVHGVESLTVADASVIPVSVNANIHLTCTMIGERAAEFLS